MINTYNVLVYASCFKGFPTKEAQNLHDATNYFIHLICICVKTLNIFVHSICSPRTKSR